MCTFLSYKFTEHAHSVFFSSPGIQKTSSTLLQPIYKKSNPTTVPGLQLLSVPSTDDVSYHTEAVVSTPLGTPSMHMADLKGMGQGVSRSSSLPTVGGLSLPKLALIFSVLILGWQHLCALKVLQAVVP